MAKMDMASNIKIETTVSPDVIDAEEVGLGVDVSGFESVTFVLQTGDYIDGSYGIQIEESDDDTLYTPVLPDSGDLINLENFPYSSNSTDYTITDNSHEFLSFWVGYIGSKRYVRGIIYEDSASAGSTFGAQFILGDPHSAPTV